jgi:phosphatidate cytidylyltransferase
MIDGAMHTPGWPAFFLLLTVKLGDTGAYFVGSRFGRHKLAPRISPKKSWEGLLGGTLFSLLAASGWWLVSGGKLGALDLPLPHMLILGLVLHGIGTIGDLVESLFKRAVDMKDSGHMVHGVGGVLDMIDSLLFTAPFFYIYVYAFIK